MIYVEGHNVHLIAEETTQPWQKQTTLLQAQAEPSPRTTTHSVVAEKQ